jgi:hypothetical protein
MPVAPLCDPYDFFRGRRDETGPHELSHTTCNESTYDATFFAKLQRVEGERIASSIRQRRQVWEPFRIVQYTDDPEMIETTLRVGCISQVEGEWNGTAGIVESCDFGSPKIIGFYCTTQFHSLHDQYRKFCNSGADIEAAAAPA